MGQNDGVAPKKRSYMNRVASRLLRIKGSVRRRVRRLVLPEEPPWGPEYRGYSDQDLAVFQSLPPQSRKGEAGFLIDFLGVRTRLTSLKPYRPYDGKVLGIPVAFKDLFHADTVEWIGLLKSVLSARERYVALELGAGWGPWIVGGATAARRMGIRELKLYGVEGDPGHFQFMNQHLIDNGLDPAEHCLFNAAVGVTAGRVRWPKVDDPADDWGSRPLGDIEQRDQPSDEKNGPDYLGRHFDSFIEVEVLTFAGLLEREPIWDFVHSDVQGSEYALCRSSIEIMNQRVRWLVVGTHSRKIEGDLIELMFSHNWVLENEKPCQFRFNPSSHTLTAMTHYDGTQVWRNPRLTSAPE